MEELKPREDFPLRMDIARDEVRIWVQNFLDHAKSARVVAPSKEADGPRVFLEERIGVLHVELDKLFEEIVHTF